jgi:hypothetical protein
MNRRMKMDLRYGSQDSVNLQVMWCRLNLLEAEQHAIMFAARQPMVQGPTGYNQTVSGLVQTARSINRSIRVLRRRVTQVEYKLLCNSVKEAKAEIRRAV